MEIRYFDFGGSDIPFFNEFDERRGVLKSVRMMATALFSVNGERDSRFLVRFFENIAVFGIGNDVVAVAVYHKDGDLFLDQGRDFIDGMSAEADQFAFCHTERVQNLFIQRGTSVNEAIAHAERPAEEIHDGRVEIQNADEIRIFSREIDSLQTAAAHADGNAFLGESVRFVQKFGKSRLGIGVDIRTNAVYILQISEVIASAKQFDLKQGECAEIFGLQHPMLIFRALGRENDRGVSSLEFKFDLAELISPDCFCHGVNILSDENQFSICIISDIGEKVKSEGNCKIFRRYFIIYINVFDNIFFIC